MLTAGCQVQLWTVSLSKALAKLLFDQARIKKYWRNMQVDNEETYSQTQRRVIAPWAMQMAVGLLIFGAIMFLAAGRIDWVEGWAYLGLNAFTQLLSAVILIPRQPEMLADRSQVQQGTKSWDRSVGGELCTGTWMPAFRAMGNSLKPVLCHNRPYPVRTGAQWVAPRSLQACTASRQPGRSIVRPGLPAGAALLVGVHPTSPDQCSDPDSNPSRRSGIAARAARQKGIRLGSSLPALSGNLVKLDRKEHHNEQQADNLQRPLYQANRGSMFAERFIRVSKRRCQPAYLAEKCSSDHRAVGRIERARNQ